MIEWNISGKKDNARKTGTSGGTEAKLSEIDKLVLEILGRNSANVVGLGNQDSLTDEVVHRNHSYEDENTTESELISPRLCLQRATEQRLPLPTPTNIPPSSFVTADLCEPVTQTANSVSSSQAHTDGLSVRTSTSVIFEFLCNLYIVNKRFFSS